mgnify:CR=1 FL=1
MEKKNCLYEVFASIDKYGYYIDNAKFLVISSNIEEAIDKVREFLRSQESVRSFLILGAQEITEEYYQVVL